MKEFKRNRPGRDSGRFNRGDSGRRGRSRERPRRRDSDREMHRITCDECGQSCDVPFKPTEGKPIYCDDCFKKNRNSGQSDGLAEINKKLDKIMKALEID